MADDFATFDLDTDDTGALHAPVGAFDTDTDGVADAVGFDLNEDGIVDTAAVDTDADGVADTVGFDLNEDGIVDYAVTDAGGDGVPDAERGFDLDDGTDPLSGDAPPPGMDPGDWVAAREGWEPSVDYGPEADPERSMTTPPDDITDEDLAQASEDLTAASSINAGMNDFYNSLYQ